MTRISLTVNGEAIEAEVEPRTHLGDFLRESQLLTGTHLGCEHGVCGACTVEIDGAPARSCITLAVACEGADVRTIEGFDDDPLMARLRDAFTQEHALQCGYCTPGMLIAARDVVQRLPRADEVLIRHEIEGNLCRCTGYVGIVRAVRSVIGEAVVTAEAVGAPTVSEQAPPNCPDDPILESPLVAPPAPAVTAPPETALPAGATRLRQEFVIGARGKRSGRCSATSRRWPAACRGGADHATHRRIYQRAHRRRARPHSRRFHRRGRCLVRRRCARRNRRGVRPRRRHGLERARRGGLRASRGRAVGDPGRDRDRLRAQRSPRPVRTGRDRRRRRPGADDAFAANLEARLAGEAPQAEPGRLRSAR